VEENRFGIIVGSMSQDYVRCPEALGSAAEEVVAQVACCCFNAAPALASEVPDGKLFHDDWQSLLFCYVADEGCLVP
jgi:hypothetical protein